MKYDRHYSTINKVRPTLAKDVHNKKVTGVCAGIAAHYNLPCFAVRIAAIAALIMLPVPTATAYIVASLLLPNNSSY